MNCQGWGLSDYNGGGAILFKGIELQSILEYCCVENCVSNYGGKPGQFIVSSTAINKKNEIYFSYITKCPSNNNLDRRDPLRFEYGNQICNNINSTNHILSYHSGFNFNFPNSLFCTFSLFFNNSATNSICVQCNGGSNLRNLTKCIFINNNSPTQFGVVTAGYVSVTSFLINQCIFENNKNILFYTYSGEMFINNCYISHLEQIYYGNLFTLNNNYYFTNTFQFSKIYCNITNFQSKNIKIKIPLICLFNRIFIQ